mmetsp:Transcript_10048/g.15319  ORF Transcript_10048/g.15319 Transcript_10048/m.15319 type:complete len:88 (+) Transcript_10048:5660-5923(+)
MTPEQLLDKNLEELITFSLIEQEGLDKAGKVKRFRVSPFVEQYIQMKIDTEIRRESLNIICTHLQAKLIDFKKQYAESMSKCRNLDD